jgi:YVTN family beta-propeller protein
LGSQPAGVVITPDGKFAYVTSKDVTKIGSIGTTVSVISTATNTVVGSITVGTAPLGLAISTDGKYAYVANTHDGTISVINAVTNTIFGRPISVGNSPVGVAVTPNGKYVFVTNNRDKPSNRISSLDHQRITRPLDSLNHGQSICVKNVIHDGATRPIIHWPFPLP